MAADSTEDSDPTVDDYCDPVAERALAYRKLLESIEALKDDDLRKEGMLMLAAVRLSFKTIKTGELSTLQGGKTSASQ